MIVSSVFLALLPLAPADGVEPAIHEVEPVLPPEQLAFDDAGGGAEHPELPGLGGVLTVEGLHALAPLRGNQCRAVVAVLLRDGLADPRQRDVPLLRPQRAEDGMREGKGVEAQILR